VTSEAAEGGRSTDLPPSEPVSRQQRVRCAAQGQGLPGICSYVRALQNSQVVPDHRLVQRDLEYVHLILLPADGRLCACLVLPSPCGATEEVLGNGHT
jgi:hypothetical protein